MTFGADELLSGKTGRKVFDDIPNCGRNWHAINRRRGAMSKSIVQRNANYSELFIRLRSQQIRSGMSRRLTL